MVFTVCLFCAVICVLQYKDGMANNNSKNIWEYEMFFVTLHH